MGISIVLRVHTGIYCVTDSPTMKIRTSYKTTVAIVVVFTFSCVLLFAVYMRWKLELHLFWKDHFGKLEDGNVNKHVWM